MLGAICVGLLAPIPIIRMHSLLVILLAALSANAAPVTTAPSAQQAPTAKKTALYSFLQMTWASQKSDAMGRTFTRPRTSTLLQNAALGSPIFTRRPSVVLPAHSFAPDVMD